MPLPAKDIAIAASVAIAHSPKKHLFGRLRPKPAFIPRDHDGRWTIRFMFGLKGISLQLWIFGKHRFRRLDEVPVSCFPPPIGILVRFDGYLYKPNFGKILGRGKTARRGFAGSPGYKDAYW